MVLFTFEAFRPLATAIEEAKHAALGCFEVARFDNGELHVNVSTLVADQRCLILGSIGPPDEQLLASLLLAHTLRKEKARSVTAILPYLAYTRHDKDKPCQSLATEWTGLLARASGIDQVITVDVHSEKAKRLYPIPLISLSGADVFAEALRRYGLAGATLVAPDEGALGRCKALQTAAGMAPGEIPYFEKHRTGMGISHSGLIGEVGRQVVIVDDILDTGGTLLSACEKLSEAGVEEIHIMVTHGLFTGDRWKALWRLGVKRIFCTDSVPLPASVDGSTVVRLSIAPLLGGALQG